MVRPYFTRAHVYSFLIIFITLAYKWTTLFLCYSDVHHEVKPFTAQVDHDQNAHRNFDTFPIKNLIHSK